jgi:hypothetical protein
MMLSIFLFGFTFLFVSILTSHFWGLAAFAFTIYSSPPSFHCHPCLLLFHPLFYHHHQLSSVDIISTCTTNSLVATKKEDSFATKKKKAQEEEGVETRGRYISSNKNQV